nr:MAG TPA: hypothetical protein [Caudoviricetes sp.]
MKLRSKFYKNDLMGCGTIYSYHLKFSHFYRSWRASLYAEIKFLLGYFEFSLAISVNLSTNSLFAAV